MRAWSVRPFARTFDLISSEYGWTDDQILQLTIGRFRQVRDVLMERSQEERRERLQEKEMEVRALAQFMARSNKALAAARTLQFLVPPEGADGASQYTRTGKRIGMIPTSMIAGLERAV